MSQYSHFISAPMSAIPADEYAAFRGLLVNLVGALEKKTERPSFCAAIHAEATNFDLPADAYTMDVKAVRASDEFVMIWPKACNSSVIFEAGYAAGLGKPLTIFVKDRKDLPFMMRHADEQQADNITIVPYRTEQDIASHMGLAL